MLRRLLRASGVLAVTLIASSCGSGTDAGLQAVRDSADPPLMFFEVPTEWSVYRSADLAGTTATPFVATTGDFTLPVESRVVFQGAGLDAGIPDDNPSDSAVPVGSAVVRTIPATQRDLISRYWLAELVVPYHSQPAANLEYKEDVSVGAGFDGVQLIVTYNDAETDADAAVIFISVTDPEVTRMYSIAVGCSIPCFNEHVDDIVAVIDSWLVNTR